MELQINDIMHFLEHRYPFLMIDVIEEIEKGDHVIARKNVSANEPWNQGHFSGNPILPGVLIIEACAQAGAFIFFNENNDGKMKGMLTKVEDFKFIKSVRPGDVMRIEVKLNDHFDNITKVRATVSVDGKKVAGGKITFVTSNGEPSEW
jgi:3-hydroxyacyl-[acyl-carrier-protein] dehydratase